MNINLAIEECCQAYNQKQPVETLHLIESIHTVLKKINYLNQQLQHEILPSSLLLEAKALRSCQLGFEIILKQVKDNFIYSPINDYISLNINYDKTFNDLKLYVKRTPVEKTLYHCMALLNQQKQFSLLRKKCSIDSYHHRLKSQKFLMKVHSSISKRIPSSHKELNLFKRVIQLTLVKINSKDLIEINFIINLLHEISCEKTLQKITDQHRLKPKTKTNKPLYIRRMSQPKLMSLRSSPRTHNNSPRV